LVHVLFSALTLLYCCISTDSLTSNGYRGLLLHG
jgi:hypothetical protein